MKIWPIAHGNSGFAIQANIIIIRHTAKSLGINWVKPEELNKVYCTSIYG